MDPDIFGTMAVFAVLGLFWGVSLREKKSRLISLGIMFTIALLIWLTIPPPGGEYFEDGVEIIPGLIHILALFFVVIPVGTGLLVGVGGRVLLSRKREKQD